MGYRHYFVLVEKTKVEELRNLTMEKIKEEFNLLEDIKVTYGTTEYDMKKYGEKNRKFNFNNNKHTDFRWNLWERN